MLADDQQAESDLFRRVWVIVAVVLTEDEPVPPAKKSSKAKGKKG